MHPMEEQCLRQKQERQAVRQQRRDATERATAVYDLHFMHIRPPFYMGQLPTKGGVTLAYQFTSKHGDRRIVRVSCALVHENDCYCKREGRFKAVQKFKAHESIEVRVPRNMSPSLFLKRMFGEMV